MPPALGINCIITQAVIPPPSSRENICKNDEHQMCCNYYLLRKRHISCFRFDGVDDVHYSPTLLLPILSPPGGLSVMRLSIFLRSLSNCSEPDLRRHCFFSNNSRPEEGGRRAPLTPPSSSSSPPSPSASANAIYPTPLSPFPHRKVNTPLAPVHCD